MSREFIKYSDFYRMIKPNIDIGVDPQQIQKIYMHVTKKCHSCENEITISINSTMYQYTYHCLTCDHLFYFKEIGTSENARNIIDKFIIDNPKKDYSNISAIQGNDNR